MVFCSLVSSSPEMVVGHLLGEDPHSGCVRHFLESGSGYEPVVGAPEAQLSLSHAAHPCAQVPLLFVFVFYLQLQVRLESAAAVKHFHRTVTGLLRHSHEAP